MRDFFFSVRRVDGFFATHYFNACGFVEREQRILIKHFVFESICVESGMYRFINQPQSLATASAITAWKIDSKTI